MSRERTKMRLGRILGLAVAAALGSAAATGTSAHGATVLVTSTLADNVLSYEVSGKTWTLNGAFANSSSDLAGGAALDAPAPLAFDGANVYVGEQKDGGRILKFTAGGAFVGVVATEGLAGNFTGSPDAMTIGPDGNLYMSVAFGANPSDRVYKIDLANGNAVTTFIGQNNTATPSAAGTYAFNNPRGITFDDDGVFYVADRQGGQIRKFDSTGVFLGNLTGATEPNGISYDAANDRLLLTSRSGAAGNPGLTLAYNTAGNGGTFISELNRQTGSNGFLDVENIGGEIFYTNFGADAVRVIDTTTTNTIVASGVDLDGVSHMQVVPEPASVALLGLGGLAAVSRRRRRA